MKRLYLSLWCGIVIPFLYFLLLVVLDSIFGAGIGERARWWLLFPLTWSGRVFASFYKPPINSVGDAFGAVANLILVVLVSNVIFYALLTYLVLWMRARLRAYREGKGSDWQQPNKSLEMTPR